MPPPFIPIIIITTTYIQFRSFIHSFFDLLFLNQSGHYLLFSEMAAKMAVLLVFALAAIAGSGPLSVQADTSCLNSLLSMMPCISYVSDESPEVSPPCCPSISAVLASQPLCLCYVLNGEVGKLLSKPIDESRALGLPGICKLTTPPITECNSM